MESPFNPCQEVAPVKGTSGSGQTSTARKSPLEFSSCNKDPPLVILDYTSDDIRQDDGSGRNQSKFFMTGDTNEAERNGGPSSVRPEKNCNGKESSWNSVHLMEPNINSNMPATPFPMPMMSPMNTDPSILAMVGMPNFNQFPLMDSSISSIAPIMYNMPIKQIIYCSECTLFPPPPKSASAFGPTHKRPPGCKTIFVGGIPENTTKAMMRDIFLRCGPIDIIRMSKKNKKFCHIRFDSEECVDNALFFSGYKIRISEGDKNSATGRLHVDFAEARKDQYEWECSQRSLHREMRHRERLETEKLRPPSPPPVVHFTEHEALRLIERLKAARTCDNSLSDVVHTLVKWLERGDCKKKSAGMFYNLIQGTNSFVRRLINEKKEQEEQWNKARQLYNDQMNAFIKQFDQIDKVFTAACQQKVWDHFTKAQRKSIETWRRLMQEVKKAHLSQLWNERGEEEMDLSDEDCEPPTKLAKLDCSRDEVQDGPDSVPLDQYKELEEENGALKCQNEAFKNELDINDTTYNQEIGEKNKQIKLLQQTLQGMQQQLMKFMQDSNPKEDHVLDDDEALNEKNDDDDVVLIESEPQTKPNDGDSLQTDNDLQAKEISTVQPIPSSLSENSLLDDDRIRLIGYLSSFLLVHPCGATLEHIWSYLQSQNIVPTLELANIENFMLQFPRVFKQQFSSAEGKVGQKWTFQQAPVVDNTMSSIAEV